MTSDQSYGLERSSRQTKEETKKKTVEEHYLTNGKQNDGVSNSSQAKEPGGENEKAAKFTSKNENDYGRVSISQRRIYIASYKQFQLPPGALVL